MLERQNKDLHIQNLAYEANNGGSNDFSRLSEQVTSLTQQLENESKEKLDAIKDVRKFERQVKELQVLLADKERHLAKIEEDLNKAEDKFKKCKTTCDEMVIELTKFTKFLPHHRNKTSQTLRFRRENLNEMFPNSQKPFLIYKI